MEQLALGFTARKCQSWDSAFGWSDSKDGICHAFLWSASAGLSMRLRHTDERSYCNAIRVMSPGHKKV